jgi:hypothetical protein
MTAPVSEFGVTLPHESNVRIVLAVIAFGLDVHSGNSVDSWMPFSSLLVSLLHML